MIQNLLQSITIYHMMYMTTLTTTIDQINRLFEDFLWGFHVEMGRRKTLLVAWSRLTQHKEKGGLGFKDYLTHANVLLNRWVERGLEETQSKWTVTFMSLVHEFL